MSDHLFIEKRNTCPDRTRIIHNVQLRVGYQNKETKNKKKIPISTLILDIFQIDTLILDLLGLFLDLLFYNIQNIMLILIIFLSSACKGVEIKFRNTSYTDFWLRWCLIGHN